MKKSIFFFMTFFFSMCSAFTIPDSNAISQSVFNEQDQLAISTILSTYKKNTSLTPDFYLTPLQKAIYQHKDDFNDIYNVLKDPAQLGPGVVQYLKNPNINFEEMKHLIYQEIPFSSKFLLDQIPFSDIFNYIKTVALQYAKNCIKIVPDIVFRPESGLFFQHKDIPYVFVSNFSSEHGGGTRVNEVKHNRKWFADQGYTIIDIPDEFPFEGGAEVKYVKHGDSVDLLCGWGYRTSRETITWLSEKLKEILKEDFEKVRIFPIRMISEEYYHLDTALKEIPVIENGEIVDETIMYYPNAFDEESKDLLKKLYPNALVLSKSDAQNFAPNSPTIDKAIIIDERVSSDLQNELKRRGIKVISIDISEFYKGGGGSKCLICELDSDLFRFEKCYNNKFQMLGSTINIFDAVYVNDPYMLSCIGTINKGLAQKQHENLINLLKNEVCEIYLMDTKKFQEPFDFETLRKAAYKICINNLYLDKLDDVIIEAMKFYKEKNITESKYPILLTQIYDLYNELFNSNPTYSWAPLALAIQEMKKQQCQKGIDKLIIQDIIINNPEDFLLIEKGDGASSHF